MVDGRTRVLFESGKEHRYKPASMGKLTLADPKAKLRAAQRCAWSTTVLISNVFDAPGKRSASFETSARSETGTRLQLSRAEKVPTDLEEQRRSSKARSQSERSPSRRPLTTSITDSRPVTLSRFGANMKLVVVHAINDGEVDGVLDGCEFEHFFSTTPPDLVQAGIFSQIASPLFFYSPDFRKVSLTPP